MRIQTSKQWFTVWGISFAILNGVYYTINGLSENGKYFPLAFFFLLSPLLIIARDALKDENAKRQAEDIENEIEDCAIAMDFSFASLRVKRVGKAWLNDGVVYCRYIGDEIAYIACVPLHDSEYVYIYMKQGEFKIS